VEFTISVDIMNKVCTKCKESKPLSEFSKKKGYKDGIYSRCRSCENEDRRDYVSKNKEKVKLITDKYYKNNKKRINEHRRIYQKKRRNSDYLFKLKHSIRGLTHKAFSRNGFTKKSKTKDLLGCEFDLAKEHIEKQFTKGMDWSNYGDWHIDHIIPLCSADNKEDLIKLCHYTNLQPLWAEDNLSKGGKYQIAK
jgi:hypothetical protein